MDASRNHPRLKQNRKELRGNLTPAEAALWKQLKGRQLEGRKFRRQHSLGPYIVDFFCPSESLSIELDGEMHYNLTAAEKDQTRSDYLKGQGVREIRFENRDVFENMEGVLRSIKASFINDM